MVQATLTFGPILLALACMASLTLIGIVVADMVNQMKPQHLQSVHTVEVGKTLALHRMRRLGIEGDWRQYTTAALARV